MPHSDWLHIDTKLKEQYKGLNGDSLKCTDTDNVRCFFENITCGKLRDGIKSGNNYVLKYTQLNINLVDEVHADNKMQLRVILEDDLHDTEDGCEFPVYSTPYMDKTTLPLLSKSTIGTWYLGTAIMKKYFSVLDVSGAKT